MKTKIYLLTSAVIFTVIVILHLARIFYSWPAAIGFVSVPVWVSYLAVIIAAYLAYHGFTLGRR